MRTHARAVRERAPAVRRRRPRPVAVGAIAALRAQRLEVRRILDAPRLQRKLVIGPPDDAYEREADRVADRVLRLPEPGRLQRMCPECEEEEESLRRQQIEEEEEELQLRRQEEEEEEEELQPLRAPGGACCQEVQPDYPERVRAARRSGGRPLSGAERRFFEPRFGRDFSAVRLHENAVADAAARSVSARAYTLGGDIVFRAGAYQPGTREGRRLLAHELTHVVQQTAAAPAGRWLARQCDPAWAALPWADRVGNVKAMANGAAKNECMKDMIDEALYANTTVLEKTNNSPSVRAAINAGRYDEWGSLSDVQVNFDANLNAKVANVYGQTTFQQPTPNDIEIYLVLGPQALNEIGPQFTRMAYDHESEHAGDFLLQFATGTPHAATSGEELVIYAEGFSTYFLDMWTIDTSACSFSFAEDFSPLFSYYPSASAAEQDEAFESIELFHQVRIQRIPCNEMKFKIWLQHVMNNRPAGDALVTRLNGLPGLGLTRGTAPATHFNCNVVCP